MKQNGNFAQTTRSFLYDLSSLVLLLKILIVRTIGQSHVARLVCSCLKILTQTDHCYFTWSEIESKITCLDIDKGHCTDRGFNVCPSLTSRAWPDSEEKYLALEIPPLGDVKIILDSLWYKKAANDKCSPFGIGTELLSASAALQRTIVPVAFMCRPALDSFEELALILLVSNGAVLQVPAAYFKNKA